MNKQLILTLFSIALIVLFIGNVIAVTASIGNARMILRAKVGDTVQKTILVKNINNESVLINMTASGDLQKDIKILDSNFTLAPGAEKDARFTIKITKEGAFENRINVFFFSLSEKKGVALSSNVVVMVDNDGFVNDVNDTDPDDNIVDPIEDTNNTGKESNPVFLLLSITGAILLIFFVVLIVYYIKTGKKKEEVIVEESKEDFEKEKESDEGRKAKKTKPKKRFKKK